MPLLAPHTTNCSPTTPPSPHTAPSPHSCVSTSLALPRTTPRWPSCPRGTRYAAHPTPAHQGEEVRGMGGGEAGRRGKELVLPVIVATADDEVRSAPVMATRAATTRAPRGSVAPHPAKWPSRRHRGSVAPHLAHCTTAASRGQGRTAGEGRGRSILGSPMLAAGERREGR